MQTLHESKFVTIELREQPFRHLVTRWNGFSPNDDFLESIDIILKCIATHKMRLVLNDIRKHQAIGTEAQAEAAKKVKEFIEKNHPFSQAMLVPNEVFVQFATQNFDKKLRAQMKEEVNRFFSTEEEALSWLAEKNNS